MVIVAFRNFANAPEKQENEASQGRFSVNQIIHICEEIFRKQQSRDMLASWQKPPAFVIKNSHLSLFLSLSLSFSPLCASNKWNLCQISRFRRDADDVIALPQLQTYAASQTTSAKNSTKTQICKFKNSFAFYC